MPTASMPQNNAKEERLKTCWSGFCDGNIDAFDEMVQRMYKMLHNYGTKFTEDEEMIKDCLQDLFLDLWDRRAKLHAIEVPRLYLLQAFRNNLIHRMRNNGRFTSQDDEVKVLDIAEESGILKRETDEYNSDRLRIMMDMLPKRQREALYLRYYENLSYQEIADLMGLRRQAVANYLQLGVQKMKQYWCQVVFTGIILLSIFL